MAKIEHSFEILKLLRTGDKFTSNDIAEKVGITTRQVKTYIINLKNIGFDIESVNGRYGGYILHEIILNTEELDLLYSIKNKLQGEEKKIFDKILKKINYRFNWI